MLKFFYLNRTGSEVGEDVIVKEMIGLYDYHALKEAASSIVTDEDARYQGYAKVEAYAIDQGYFILMQPYQVSKVILYTQLYASYGLSKYKYKKMQSWK